MDRAMLDRWTDTLAFRIVLFLAGVAVAPVLALGALVTLIGGAVVLVDARPVELEQAVFALLSLGGVLGFAGYSRAHSAMRRPETHNVAATLLCLAVGIIAALVVAGVVLAGLLADWRDPWTGLEWQWLPMLFAAANVAWAAAGRAWMQRLTRRYAERTGRAFDGLPPLLLFVALSLATAAALVVTTL